MTIRVYIPGPATPERKRQVHRGSFTRRVDTPQAADYKAHVKACVAAVMAGRPPLEGPLGVRMTVWRLKPQSWPKRRQEPDVKPDLSNSLKIVEDACNKLLWRDDAQVCYLVMRKRFGVTEGVGLAVWPILPGQPAEYEPEGDDDHDGAA